jgi:hypothetical protein
MDLTNVEKTVLTKKVENKPKTDNCECKMKLLDKEIEKFKMLFLAWVCITASIVILGICLTISMVKINSGYLNFVKMQSDFKYYELVYNYQTKYGYELPYLLEVFKKIDYYSTIYDMDKNLILKMYTKYNKLKDVGNLEPDVKYFSYLIQNGGLKKALIGFSITKMGYYNTNFVTELLK